MLKSAFFAAVIAGICMPGVEAATRISDASPISWIVGVTQNSSEKTYDGAEINKLIDGGIKHKALGVDCKLALRKEWKKFQGKKIYQESLGLRCILAGVNVDGASLICNEGETKYDDVKFSKSKKGQLSVTIQCMSLPN